MPGTPTAGPTSKKKSLHDSQRDTPRVQQQRAAFVEKIDQEWAGVIQRLKFIDESGANLGLTRWFGRATPGERVVDASPGHSGPPYTMVATLGWQAIQAPWVLKGAMDGTAFEAYVEQVLSPTLHRGDLVVLDNLSAHKGERIRQLIEARGAHLEYLPPYSPDFNPIELCWSKIKTALRAAKARTLDALLDAVADALRSVSRSDIRAWFAHCGYVPS